MAGIILITLSVMALFSRLVTGQLNVDNAENMAGVPVITVDKLPWDQTVILNCSAHIDTVTEDIYPENSVPEQWLLPRGSDGVIPIVGMGETRGNVNVTADAMFLTINNITAENFGLYHCMRMTSEVEGGYYLVRIGVNTGGPYFQDIWTLWYKKSTFQGLFGFTLSLAIICAVYVIYDMIEKGLPKEEEEMDAKHAAKVEEINLAYVSHSNEANGFSTSADNTSF